MFYIRKLNNYKRFLPFISILILIGFIIPFAKPLYSIFILLMVISILALLLFYKGIWFAIVLLLFVGPLFPYTYYFDGHEIFHHGGAYPGFVVTPTYIAILFSILLMIIFYYNRIKSDLKIEKSIVIWLVFGLYGFLISFINAVSIKASFFELNNMIIVASVPIMLYLLLSSKEKLKIIIYAIGLILVIESSIAFLQQFGILPKDLIFGGYSSSKNGPLLFVSQLFVRPCGTLRETNTLAKLLSMYIPIYFILSLIEKNIKNKLFFLLVFVFSFFALLLTLGRSSIIGTIVGSIYSFFLLGKYSSHNFPSRKFIISSIIVIVVIVLLIVLSLFKLLYLRFFVFGYLTLEGRLDQYQNALYIINHNFLFGIGLNNYDFTMAMNDVSGVAAAEPQYPAHNLYLLYFAETGIIGITLFISFIYSIYYSVISELKNLISNRDIDIYSLAILIGGIGGLTSVFILSFLGWGLRSITLYSVFFLIGLILSVIKLFYKRVIIDYNE